MKKLKITVNNRTYDVLVEVLEDDERAAAPRPVVAPQVAAPASVPATALPAPATALPAPSPKASSPPPKASGEPKRAGPGAVLAPIAGTVRNVFVQAGAVIDAKSPVVLLDAMMMDTYVYPPTRGLVTEVAVAPGRIVQVGDCLIRYEAQ
jgi:biotin carboxyl carrier protein